MLGIAHTSLMSQGSQKFPIRGQWRGRQGKKEKSPRLFSPGRLGSPPSELPNHETDISGGPAGACPRQPSRTQDKNQREAQRGDRLESLSVHHFLQC